MIDQIALGTLGVTAVLLSQHPEAAVRRYACLFGIAAQPFWFYATWKAQQWGIFGLSVLYSAAWLRGFYSHWIAPRSAVRTGEA